MLYKVVHLEKLRCHILSYPWISLDNPTWRISRDNTIYKTSFDISQYRNPEMGYPWIFRDIPAGYNSV